ncbi:MAG TPA: DNA-3-methyladenine glycosylase [Chloroflexota bacterium]|nr:DNA-3-methyladenine glycosylase [Chloroflexota bacterium]
MPLPRSFYERPTLVVARELLGCLLVHRDKRVRIVETEAYIGPDDLAAHSAGGRRTARNEVMWGEAGHAYVYFIYGMYHCLNVVTEQPGIPSAVLIRAADPGAKGPGVLCRELGITRADNGLDLTASELTIEPGTPPASIVETTRIGVDYAGEWALKPWRFYEQGNRWVSKPVKAS